MTLTDRDLETLSRARYLHDAHDSGIFPSTIGDRSHFVKLVRMGMLRFNGWGRDVDGIRESDVMVYALTPKGRAHADANRIALATGTLPARKLSTGVSR